MSPNFKFFLAMVALFALLGHVGVKDFEEELQSERAYCERVGMGLHTNYKEIDCARHARERNLAEAVR